MWPFILLCTFPFNFLAIFLFFFIFFHFHLYIVLPLLSNDLCLHRPPSLFGSSDRLGRIFSPAHFSPLLYAIGAVRVCVGNGWVGVRVCDGVLVSERMCDRFSLYFYYFLRKLVSYCCYIYTSCVSMRSHFVYARLELIRVEVKAGAKG